MHAVISNRKSSFRFAVLVLIFNVLVGSLVAWLLLKPAHGSSNSATWTTKADFETNSITTNDSTISDGVNIIGKNEESQVMLNSEQVLNVKAIGRINLQDIHFSSPTSGYAVGMNQIFKIKNENGSNWSVTSVSVPTNASGGGLQSVFALNDKTAFTVGGAAGNGALFKTTDGGKTWTNILNNYYNDVFFINELTGYVVGNNGSILKTEDGGQTWVQQTSNTTKGLRAVYFKQSKGYIVGNSGTLLITQNGGKDWELKTLESTFDFNSIIFTNDAIGYIAGRSDKMLKTMDGGQSWTSKSLGGYAEYKNIHFPTAGTGFVVGRNRIVKINDTASVWETQVFEENKHSEWLGPSNINSVFFTTPSTGFSVGWDGLVLETNDQGNSWQYKSPRGLYELKDIYFPSENIGYALDRGYFLFKTVNGGKTWDTISFNPKYYDRNKIFFVDDETGFIIARDGVILKTTDGGKNWERKPTMSNAWLSGIYFVNELIGYVVGNNGTILKTEDGGENWVAKDSGTTANLTAVHFPVGDKNGYVTTDNGQVLKTEDYGDSWQAKNLWLGWKLNDIQFTDLQIGYVAGFNGHNYRTLDGGKTWTRFLLSVNGNNIHFNKAKGYLASDQGKVYVTYDSGYTWDLVGLGPNTGFLGLQQTSEKIGYTVGSNFICRIEPEHINKGTIKNLKINAGDGGFKGKWNSISWNGDTPVGTSIKFRTRGADSEDGLTSANWSDYYTDSGSSITTASSQWLEIELTLETTDPSVTPVLNDFTVNYDKVINDITPPTGSIVINDDAEYTNNRGVTLTINAEDPGNPDSILNMRFSNDNENWSQWEPYETSRTWTLLPDDGEKTVHAQFKDQAGNISTDYVFKDSFDTNTFKDPINNTADWDVAKGEIRLPTLYLWSRKTDPLGYMEEGASLAYNSKDGKIYALRGDHSRKFYVYDPQTSQWSTKPDTPGNVHQGGHLVYNSHDGKLYAIGGWASPSSFWVFDFITNDWTSLAPPPDSFVNYGAGLIFNSYNNKIYALRGYPTNDFWSYSPATNTWEALAPTPEIIGIIASAEYSPYDNKIFVLRGHGDRTFWAYDIENNLWESKQNITRGSAWSADLTYNVDDQKIYAILGWSDSFLRYDPKIDQWEWSHEPWTNLPFNLYDAASFVYISNNKAFYALGEGANNFWAFEFTYQSPNAAQSLTIDKTPADITRATLSATERLNGQTITYQLSRDGGITWEDVVNGQLHIFNTETDKKSDLRWRATLNGTEDVTPVILDVSVTYNREPISDSIKLDQTPPDILLTSPEPRSYLQTEETIPVNYWVSDDLSSVITEEASLIYKDLAGQQQVIPVFKGEDLKEKAVLVPGTVYTLQVKATDNCGNIATKSVSFTIAPSITASYYSCNGPYADKLIYRKTPASRAVGDPLNTLGAPDGRFYRLGDEGNYIELEFADNKIIDGKGNDLTVFSEHLSYTVYVKNEETDYLMLNKKPVYGNQQFDLNEAGIDHATMVKIQSEYYAGPSIDAVQAIHPGPYADEVIGSQGVATSSLHRALGPKDGIGAAIGAGKYIELSFDDNQPVDGPGYDLRIHEAQVKESYKLYIKEDGSSSFIYAGLYKGSQNIDFANLIESSFKPKKAVAVRLEGISDQYAADIDSVEALHPGPYADEIIYSNIKTADQKEPVGLDNILGPRDGILTGLIKRGQFVELAFTDNEIINGKGPDIAIFAPSEVDIGMPAGAYKLFVKESASDVGFKEVITPKRLIGNQNVYLNDDIKKVEILRIVGDSTNLTKVDAVEALHTCDENDIIVRLQSDFNVWPGGSEPVANIAASITPLHMEPGFKLSTLNASIDGIPVNLGNDTINLQNGITSTISFSVSVPNVSADHTGKHEVILNIPGEKAEGRITLFNNGLQKALDNSSGHNRLMLANGIYNEPIVANKPVVIQGNNWDAYVKYTKYAENTVLDSSKADKGIHVSSDHVEVYGLTIKNNNYGIYAPDVLGLEIYHNNILAYEAAGIYVEGLLDRRIHGDYPTMRYNYIDSGKSLTKADHIKTVKNRAQPIENIPATVGIGSRNSDLNIITSNTINNNVVGIKLWNSKLANAISANSLKNNLIAFYYDPIDFETQIDFSGNEIIDSKLGVVFAHPDTILLNINDNIIEKAQVGVLGITGPANIYNNNIGDSEVGIFAPSSNMKVYDNIFSDNEINHPQGVSDALQKEINSILLWALLNEPYDIKNTIFSVTNKGIANSLRSKLDGVYIDMVDTMVHIDNAKPKLANNSLGVAINRLVALQNEIQALKNNHMSAAEKENLLVLVKILQNQLEYIHR